jgi:class 3 adenylate cyclase
MAALPRGTVTFLFSDVEGSTRLLHELGPQYETLLDDQRRLLGEAIDAANGRVVDTSGDAVFAVFERAQDACAAAVNAQRAIAAHTWPEGVLPRLRMGLHTGEPSVTHEGFVGLSVHKASRICAAGHGGQVLISAATRQLVQDGLPPDVALLDVGEHHLKDFDRLEPITQLVVDGLPVVLKPVKSLDAQESETSFAGRSEELAEAAFDAPPSPAKPTRDEHTGGHLVERIAGWKGSLRGRRVRREALDALGMRLYATSRIAPGDELRAQLAKLGGAVTKVARVVSDTDQLLAGSDRKLFARRLAQMYAAPASERSVRAAEAAAGQLSAIDALAERRREFDEANRELHPRLSSLPDDVFRARLDHSAGPELRAEVDELLERVETLGATLEEARARVVAFAHSPTAPQPSTPEEKIAATPTPVDVELYEAWGRRYRPGRR